MGVDGIVLVDLFLGMTLDTKLNWKDWYRRN